MDKEKRLAAARKKLQEYKKARGEVATGSGGPVGKDPLENPPPICGNSSSSGSDSSMIIINPQYVLDNNGSHNFGSALSGPQESDLEIISTPSPSLANDDSKVASQQQSSSSSSFADENSIVNPNQNENTVGETLTSMPDAYGAPHSTTSSVPDSENEQFVFLNPPSGQELHEIPLYHPQSVSPIGIQLPQLYPQSYGNSEITDNVEMHTFAHNYNPPPQQGYSSSSFTPVSVTEGIQSPQIPMYSVPSKTENEPQQSLIQVPPQPMFYDPNSMNVTTTTSYPPISSENSMASSEPPIPNAHPYYMSYYQQHQQPATSAQPVVSDPLTVNSPYFYPQETTPSVILQPSVPQVQFVDIHPQVLSRPSSRKSNRSQELDDKDDKDSIRALQKMQSVQDALELQMEELSRDNSRLLNRQTELLSQLQENEKTIHELRRERDYSKEEAKKSLQPLHAKVNALYEENQRAMKTAGDQYNELMGRLEEKTKQFVDMEQAFIVVSQSKMEFAAQLDQERERWKESEIIMEAKDEEIRALKESSAKIEEKLKSELQKDAAVQQLEDQRRHFQVQCETLFAELSQARIRIKTLEQQLQSVPTAQAHVQTNQGDHSPHHHPQEQEHHSDHSHHDHGTGDHSPVHSDNHLQIQDDHHGHSHSHDNEHGHTHDDGHGHSHSHDDEHEHSHDDGHGHSHSHDDGHGHSHSHDDGHGHSHGHGDEHGHEHTHDSEAGKETPKQSKPMSLEKELTELKKTLLRMEWENKTYRTELDRLAVDAKAKQMYENNYNALKVESDKAKEEIGRLEHLVIQLQGENDTIGDYITLYQSQRMALRERAKEKDVQIENLAKEREGLLHKMSELNQLLKELKFNTNLGGAGAEPSVHAPHYHPQQQQSVDPQQSAQQQQQIEGKIINLITEISSSSLIENFHPCAVCSGRLMTV